MGVLNLSLQYPAALPLASLHTAPQAPRRRAPRQAPHPLRSAGASPPFSLIRVLISSLAIGRTQNNHLHVSFRDKCLQPINIILRVPLNLGLGRNVEASMDKTKAEPVL